MKTISIRQLQRNFYRELEELPVLVTRRIVTPDRKHKVVNAFWVIPFNEDDRDIIEGLVATSEEEAAGIPEFKQTYEGIEPPPGQVFLMPDLPERRTGTLTDIEEEVSAPEQPKPPVDTEPQNATENGVEVPDLSVSPAILAAFVDTLPEDTPIYKEINGKFICVNDDFESDVSMLMVEHFYLNHRRKEEPTTTQYNGEEIKGPTDFWEEDHKEPEQPKEEPKHTLFGWFKKDKTKDEPV